MTAREKAPDASNTHSSVTMGEMRAWFQAEVGRLKSDVENLYDLVRTGDQRVTATETKIRGLEPLMTSVSSVRERVTSLETAVKRLDDNDDGFLSDLDFEKFQRELDGRFHTQKEALVKSVEEKIKPISETVAAVKTKVDEMTIRFGIVTAIIVFVASKGVDLLMKALSASGN